jgi:hypothetical protein
MIDAAGASAWHRVPVPPALALALAHRRRRDLRAD